MENLKKGNRHSGNDLLCGEFDSAVARDTLKTEIINTVLSEEESNHIVFSTSEASADETKEAFQRAGYKTTKVVMGKDLAKCNYNPFLFIKSEEDIEAVLDELFGEASEEERPDKDPFWEAGERHVISFCIARLLAEGMPVTFQSLCDKLVSFGTGEEMPEDRIIDQKWAEAASKYRSIFMNTPENVRKSMIISAMVRLHLFIPSDDCKEPVPDYVSLRDAILDGRSAILVHYEDCDYSRVLINCLTKEIQSILLEEKTGTPFRFFVDDTDEDSWLKKSVCRLPLFGDRMMYPHLRDHITFMEVL